MVVVIEHLWVHVAQERAPLTFGGTAVALFLILSGFGLTLSVEGTQITLKRFVFQRLFRVMIPYWIITGIILLLDYLILNRVYSLQNVSMTFVGINIYPPLLYLDYVRWFITLLLLEYVIFFLANRFLPRFKAILFIWAFGCFLMFLNQYKIFQLGSLYQIMAFPLGCLLAYYKKDVTRIVFEKRNYLKLILLLIASLILIWCVLNFTGDDNILAKVTRISLLNLQPLLSYFLAILIVGGVGRLGFGSGFLNFIGLIAFEIYLVHGPLLIKYNPILGLFPPDYIVISFSIFFMILIALSYGFNLLLKQYFVSKKIVEKIAGQ